MRGHMKRVDEWSQRYEALIERNAAKIIVLVVFALVAALIALPVWMFYDTARTIAKFTVLATEVTNEQVRQRQDIEKLLRDEADRKKRESEPVSRAGLDRTRMMEITAYTCHPSECSKEPWEPGYCTTTAGLRLRPEHNRKIVAADPRVFKAGTKLHIDGVGIVTVSDTGNGVKGMHLDLFWDEHDRTGALKWGRQVRKVTVL